MTGTELLEWRLILGGEESVSVVEAVPDGEDTADDLYAKLVTMFPER